MLKILILLSGTLVLPACTQSGTPAINRTDMHIVYGKDYSIEEYQLAGCQYIGYLHGVYWDWCTHKGNCTNPIHSLKDTTHTTMAANLPAEKFPKK